MLKLENIVAGYGHITALKDISLEVPQGAIVSLIGANGAGKSTTMKTIMGLVKPTSGRVIFEGQDITGHKTHHIVKNGISLVPEGRQILQDMSVYENLEMGGGIAYKYNKLSSKNLEGVSVKGLSSVPVYFTTRYNFKNDSEVTPYVKGNLGVAFNSGKIEAKDGASSVKFKFDSGIYYGIGAGIQYKNFVTDLSYNVNSLRTKLDVDLPGYKANSKFNTNHGALTLGVGYSFGL